MSAVNAEQVVQAQISSIQKSGRNFPLYKMNDRNPKRDKVKIHSKSFVTAINH